MNTTIDDTTSRWINGMPYELAFWNNVYRWKWTFEGMMNWSNYGATIQLEGFDANAFLVSRTKPKVLDVGCGMSYAPGNFTEKNCRREPLDISYVDPLAEHFNSILRRHRRLLPEITFGMVEYLSSFYPDQDISLIIIQNALDHSSNPMKGIYESLATLEPTGCLYLNHHANEAETEHYKGFHQYNICEEDGKLVIWNKSRRWDVGKLTSGFAQVDVSKTDSGHVVATIRKTADVPSTLLADKKDRATLCRQLVAQVSASNCLSNIAKRKMVYWLYNATQFVAQALPWDVKMKVKKIIKQT